MGKNDTPAAGDHPPIVEAEILDWVFNRGCPIDEEDEPLSSLVVRMHTILDLLYCRRYPVDLQLGLRQQYYLLCQQAADNLARFQIEFNEDAWEDAWNSLPAAP